MYVQVRMKEKTMKDDGRSGSGHRPGRREGEAVRVVCGGQTSRTNPHPHWPKQCGRGQPA